MKKTDNPPKTDAAPGDNGASSELEKATSHIIVEIIEYVPNSVVSKTIIKKSSGNISVMSFDSGEGLNEKTSPFDTFVQIIEGKAELIIDKNRTCCKQVKESLSLRTLPTLFILMDDSK